MAIITQLPEAELTDDERAIAQDVREVAEVWGYAEQLMGNVSLPERAKQHTNHDTRFFIDEAARFDEVDYEEVLNQYKSYMDEAKRLPAIITCGRRAGKTAMGLAHVAFQNGAKHITKVEVGTPRRYGKSLVEEVLEVGTILPAVVKSDPKVPPGTVLGRPLRNTFSNREVFKTWNEFLHEIGFHAPSGDDFTAFRPEVVGPDGLPARTGLLSFEAWELLDYDIPIRKIIEDNSVKDIKEIEDSDFEYHVERASLQSFPEKPTQVTSYSQLTDIFGKHDDGAKYKGIDWVQEATDREIFADMDAAVASQVGKEYALGLGAPLSPEPQLPEQGVHEVPQAQGPVAQRGTTGVRVSQAGRPSRRLATTFSAAPARFVPASVRHLRDEGPDGQDSVGAISAGPVRRG